MQGVTAKVRINAKKVQTYQTWNSVKNATEEVLQASVQFYADYQDGANKEWAAATPNITLDMVVNGNVADFFEQGGKYTLLITRTEEAATEAATE